MGNKGEYIRYDMIRFDSVYLTCSKKLTNSQLNEQNKKLSYRRETARCLVLLSILVSR